MSTFPNFTEMDYQPKVAKVDEKTWKKALEARIDQDPIWMTNEQIPVKSLYTEADIKGIEHLELRDRKSVV